MDELVEKYIKGMSRQEVGRGLLIAQMICSRRMLEAFDTNCQDVVLLIMQDIAQSMEDMKNE